jgi:lipopolysaccharide assembly outer membrane protein LptD (OstA)
MLKRISLIIFVFIATPLFSLFAESIVGEGPKSQPIIINGDTVEYSTDAQEVTASGNVEIIYADSRLTCEKLTVNTQTKQGVASGHARLDDKQGVIEGDKLVYNFQTRTGSIVDAQFRANPYFGKVKYLDKENDTDFVARYGSISTCSFDRPHYKINSKQVNVVPGKSIQAKDNILYLGGFPLLYMPRFSRVFDKPLMHVSVMPGKRKEWGPYLLSLWRVNINPSIDGRFYLDYRNKLGWSEGFGANYRTSNGAKGDFKFYYTYENKDKDDNVNNGYNRYLLRYRHKWVIDEQTDFMAEIVKVKDDKRKYFDPDSDFLKDYFYREFEKDEQPLTYALFHHSFGYSSIDILAQKRVNQWYTYVEKLPEIKYSLPTLQLGETPFYFENNTSLATFDQKPTSTNSDEVTDTRFDMTNKLSLPTKVAFIEFTPFVKIQNTIYDTGANGESLPARSIFYTGADASTKFYRIFNINSDFMGLDINGLRHIITPSVAYSYNPKPSILANDLRQIDSIDALTYNNSAALSLSNKLQTKHKSSSGKLTSVDLVDFLVTTNYIFSPVIDGAGSKTKAGNLSDFLFKLKLLPYSWLRVEGDATYTHSGDTSSKNYNRFTQVDYDVYFDFAPDRSIGLGQRYYADQGNEITASLNWRLSPKWRFSMYHRLNLSPYIDSGGSSISRGSLEQQYSLTRDLHCWEMDLTLNRRKNDGTTIYVVFRLKAFPENEFGFDQTYKSPKSGAQ